MLTTKARLRVRRARFHSRELRRPLVAFRHRGLRPEDAFVVSYPRSGTRWTLFMLCELLTGTAATFRDLHSFIPYVGGHLRAPGLLGNGGRIVHSHETVRVGPRPIVYLIRDPRSVVLSEYRWLLGAGLFEGTFDQFVHDFVAGRSNPYGAWDAHLDVWLDHGREAPGQLLVVRYEDMRHEPEKHLARIASFLGETASPERIAEVVAANELAAMQEKERLTAPERVRGDIGCGAGGVELWRQQLSAEHAAMVTDRFAAAMRLVGYAM